MYIDDLKCVDRTINKIEFIESRFGWLIKNRNNEKSKTFIRSIEVRQTSEVGLYPTSDDGWSNRLKIQVQHNMIMNGVLRPLNILGRSYWADPDRGSG